MSFKKLIKEVFSKHRINSYKIYKKQNKYKLDHTDTIKIPDCVVKGKERVLYRLIALKDFGDVKAGDKGGYVDLDVYIDDMSDCWVYPESFVTGNIYITDEVKVYNSVIEARSKSQSLNPDVHIIHLYGNIRIEKSKLKMEYKDGEIYILGRNSSIISSTLCGDITLKGHFDIEKCTFDTDYEPMFVLFI